jgi:hypothetical protein
MVEKKRPTAEEVAHFVMAKGNADRVQAYVTRGRRFRDLNDIELREKFAEGMREWASDPRNRERRMLSDDTHAEYELRGSEPPEGVATAELDAIIAETSRVYEEMSEARKAEIDAEMNAEYLGARKDQH